MKFTSIWECRFHLELNFTWPMPFPGKDKRRPIDTKLGVSKKPPQKKMNFSKENIDINEMIII